MTQARTYCILGNGVAGISAAEAIRTVDNEGQIFLISAEKDDFYYRASLSEWIEGKNTRAMLNGRTPAFYDQLRINRINDSIEEVDTQQSILRSASRQYPFDQLLIATGAAARQMSIPGCTSPMVYRGIQDAARLLELLETKKRFLIVGGGVLGLEIAAALQKKGRVKLALLHRSNILSRPLLDLASSQWIAERMGRDGIELFLDDELSHADGTCFHLKSGRSWEGDQILLTVGIDPVFPQMADLIVGTGIQIGADCATNLAGIYAAGDCTERVDASSGRWLPCRTWLEAVRQGRIAGLNMAGKVCHLPEHAFFNASYIYKDTYVFIGDPHSSGDEIYQWQDENSLRKLRVVGGKAAGALLINQRRGSLAILQAVQEQSALPSRVNLADPAVEWNLITATNWDYRFF